MARPRRRAAWAALAGLGGLLALVGCEAEVWLAAVGVRSFREVAVPEAQQLLEDPAARLVLAAQARPRSGLARATVVEDDAPLPEALLAAGGPLLVVAADGPAGRRLAARLVRAGARRVALLVADPEALRPLGGPVLARPGAL
jgi:hypothetical protein